MNQDSPEACFHCGLPLSKYSTFQSTIAGESKKFCCLGCQSVCIAIHEAGLARFYQQTHNTPLAPPPPVPEEISLYDLDDVQRKFVRHLGTEREISLLVEGIHCPACIWLIENALDPMPGVLSANVNLSGKRLKLRWDNTKIQLSTILQKLGKIGYAALPFDPELSEGQLYRQNRTLLYRIGFAGFSAMNLMWISIALYSGASEGEFRTLFYWIGFFLATPTLFYSGYPFLKGAWQGIRAFYPTMDLPIAIGAISTYLYSSYITFVNDQSGVYFDTVVNFLFVILVGRFLESSSRRKAVASTRRVIDLQPRGATILRNGQEVTVPIEAVQIEEIVLVRPGARIPVDGVILQGNSEVDESLLTGESIPVEKQVGDSVCAGSMNHSGALQIQVRSTLQNTALGRILNLVEEAQSSKAPIQQIADQIVPWFVIVTLLLAAFTFWWHSGFSVALMASTSVLVVTCPCAFGLSTPMAIAVASGLGARHGILVRTGAVLELLSKVTQIVFDKTGTLTVGQIEVHSVISAVGIEPNEVLRRAAEIEYFSEHPIAKAILKEARELHFRVPVEDFHNFPGRGIRAKTGKEYVTLGNSTWLEQHGVTLEPSLSKHVTDFGSIGWVRVAVGKQEIGIIGLTDQLRPDAKTLIESLQKDGIQTTIMSGDRQSVVLSIAKALGDIKVYSEMSPEDKARAIEKLQLSKEVVAMVGDGVNDAPALARADVGISLGSGADVSQANADLVLISNELGKIRQAIQLSRATLRIVRQNIGISILYNTLMIPLAMVGLITPLVAAVAMPISSLLVIGNAMRIQTVFSKEEKKAWK
ncbi:P-type Cu2+ transporter [Gammaproteobacteria bacterium]